VATTYSRSGASAPEPVHGDPSRGDAHDGESSCDLIGRDAELSTLSGWLKEPDVRLVTITGPGGVGKTTLANAVADAMQDAARVVPIPLAGIPTPSLLAPTIGRALDGSAPTSEALVDLVNQQITSGPLLLVLDNLEHLLPGTEVIEALVAECPGTRLLITSREPLHLAGEREFPLMPLAAPPDDGTPSGVRVIARSPAVRLFVRRMRAVRPGFTLDDDSADDVARLCRRLDGLPLAIELAAARTRSIPLPFLVARLEHDPSLLDRPDRSFAEMDARTDRHRGLRAVAAWSYDLLSPTEQRMFRHLALLPGPFPLSAAEACDQDAEGVIASLVDKSLVEQIPSPVAGETKSWFRMLETLRQYGLERLRSAGEEPFARVRLARWALDEVEAHTVPFPSDRYHPASFAWCAALLPAIRSALTWLEESNDAPRLIRFAIRLGPFWTLQSFRTEGLTWCNHILTQVDFDAVSPDDMARFWLTIAAIARTQARIQPAIAAAERARDYYDQTGDVLLAAVSEKLLGSIYRTAGDIEAALGPCQRAVDLFSRLGERQWMALARCDLGDVLLLRGETAAAAAHLRVAEREHRVNGDAWGTTFALVGLATVAVTERNWAAALPPLREALQIATNLSARESVLDATNLIAAIAAATGHPHAALRLAAANRALRTSIAYCLEASDDALAYETLARTTAALERHAADQCQQEGSGMSFPTMTRAAFDLLDTLSAGGPLADTDPGTLSAHSHSGTTNGKPRDGREPLTSREREVLALLAEGITDREIGDRLFISPRTAMRHVANILLKLQVHSRTAAAVIYHRERAGEGPGSATAARTRSRPPAL
jgi:non-specific serine/threonine protein kinase